MIIINLKDLIYIIPDLINLFLSGFIFVTIFNWLDNKKNVSFSMVVLWSLFINFIIKNLWSFIHVFIFANYDVNNSIKIFVYLLTGLITPFIVRNLLKSKFISRLLYATNYKTINEDIFEDIIDYEEPTMMQVFLKTADVYYIGKFNLKEEKGLDSWLVLIDYARLNKQTNEVLFKPKENKLNSTIAINLRDIDRIELVYEENSKVWGRLSGNKYEESHEGEN